MSMGVTEKVDGRLEALLERLERAIQELAAKPIVVHVHMPAGRGEHGMGCSREKVLGLLVKLKQEIGRVCPKCPSALEIIEVYKERIEQVLAEEADKDLFG